MTLKKYSKSNEKVYISLNIKSDLYNIYKDLFFKDNFIYIKGYMNSYVDKNKNIKSFITVTDVGESYKEIMNGKATPYIRYDPDGAMVWNGKRCEADPWDFNNREDVKKYRELRELSQRELSDKIALLGVDIYHSDISLIENNKLLLKDFEIVAICRVLDISYNQLFEDIDNIFD